MLLAWRRVEFFYMLYSSLDDAAGGSVVVFTCSIVWTGSHIKYQKWGMAVLVGNIEVVDGKVTSMFLIRNQTWVNVIRGIAAPLVMGSIGYIKYTIKSNPQVIVCPLLYLDRIMTYRVWLGHLVRHANFKVHHLQPVIVVCILSVNVGYPGGVKQFHGIR